MIVQAETVSGVNLHGGILVAYLNMLPHYSLSLIERQTVPFALLSQRRDEEILGTHWVRLGRLAEVLRRLEHGQVGVWGREILSENGLQQRTVNLLNCLHRVSDEPSREVHICSRTSERVCSD